MRTDYAHAALVIVCLLLLAAILTGCGCHMEGFTRVCYGAAH